MPRGPFDHETDGLMLGPGPIFPSAVGLQNEYLVGTAPPSLMESTRTFSDAADAEGMPAVATTKVPSAKPTQILPIIGCILPYEKRSFGVVIAPAFCGLGFPPGNLSQVKRRRLYGLLGAKPRMRHRGIIAQSPGLPRADGVLDPNRRASYMPPYDDACCNAKSPPPPCHHGTGAHLRIKSSPCRRTLGRGTV